VIRENIRLCSEAMKTRLGIAPSGFRTPGGYGNGLEDAPDRRRMLLDLGFHLVQREIPAHRCGETEHGPDAAHVRKHRARANRGAAVALTRRLLEIPMTGERYRAFRTGRWKLESFCARTMLSNVAASGSVFGFTTAVRGYFALHQVNPRSSSMRRRSGASSSPFP